MPSLSGRWTGYFFPSDEDLIQSPRPIRATLEVAGSRLEGEMVNVNPIEEVPYQELIDAMRDQMGEAELAQADELLRLHPDAKIVAIVPERSRLKGRVRGGRVTFTKSFDGKNRWELEYGGQRYPYSELENGDVVYEGAVDASDAMIEGTWKIYARGFFGKWAAPGAQGTFRLRRE